MNESSGLRILYAGTPDFAVPALRTLVDEGFAPLAVLTQPDRPAGRGRRLQASPVKHAAHEAAIPVHQPASLKDAAARELIRSLQPDLMIVVAYGLILPPEVLSLPRHGCWNIHASLLPRWRGAAPIQRAIEAGDPESGVCIMQMDSGLDTGPVLHCERIALDITETGGSLHDRLAEAGGDALLDCVKHLAGGDPLTPRPQGSAGACYAPKLDKDEARLNWNEPAGLLERRIRAFNPWPVAWCAISGDRTRVWRAEQLPERHEQSPGTVLRTGDEGIDIATGDGVLRLLDLQPPGKRRMTAADYLNGRSLPVCLDPVCLDPAPGPESQ